MPNADTALYQTDTFIYDYADTPFFSTDIPTHTHDSWELLLVKEGNLTYTVDGNVFDIVPNSLILSRPGAVHMLRPKGTIHYLRYKFLVSESIFSKDILEKIPPYLHVLDIPDNCIIQTIYEKIDFYISNLSGKTLEKLMCALIDELLINIVLISQTSTQASVSYSNPVIIKAITFIKNNIQKPLTVQQLSDALFITPSHLHHCFIKHMHITPKQYIMLQKLQLVQQALLNNANPTDLCQYYGFKSYSTFYRNYQKIYGRRPSDDPRPTLRKIEL